MNPFSRTMLCLCSALALAVSSVAVAQEAPRTSSHPLHPRHLPMQGRIEYATHYGGENGPVIGANEVAWTLRGASYRIVSVSRTEGLAAVFKPLTVEQLSEGTVSAEGLRPERFSVRHNGAGKGENAVFDWAGGIVRTGPESAEAPLVSGAQDLVSLQYQLGWMKDLDAKVQGFEMAVATGKKFNRYKIEVAGTELLDTSLGRLRTLHVRAVDEDTTELWLALDRYMLPVKVRFIDRKGARFESLARKIEFSDAAPE
ncbi:MAG: DUF3108 domain-containing protein [Betaproteobacteria bacterium]|nr:DUF3108 domain-containing protein [Betaproteobacteria bacterium]